MLVLTQTPRVNQPRRETGSVVLLGRWPGVPTATPAITSAQRGRGRPAVTAGPPPLSSLEAIQYVGALLGFTGPILTQSHLLWRHEGKWPTF